MYSKQMQHGSKHNRRMMKKNMLLKDKRLLDIASVYMAKHNISEGLLDRNEKY